MRRRRRRQRRERDDAPRVRHPASLGLLLFLAAVFAVKALVLSQLEHHPLLEPGGGVDSAEYARLARLVIDGQVLLGPGLYYLSPLYVYFLAALLALSNSFLFVRIVQIALGTAAIGCIFVSARVWFGARAAWIAALLAALTGVFTFYEIVIFQSSIDVFLTSAALACLAVGLGRGAARPDKATPGALTFCAAAGVLLGLQCLNRPNVIVAIAGVLGTLIAVRRWRPLLATAAGIAIALAPVAVRNAMVVRHFAVTSSQGGLNFYIGNNPAATGQYVPVPGVRANIAGQAEDTRRVAEAAVGHPLSDAGVSGYFSGQAAGWIRTHPSAAATLFVRKMALTFSAQHQWLDFSYPYYAHDAGTSLDWLAVGPWLLVPLGLAGLAARPRQSSPHRGAGAAHDPRATAAFMAWASFVPFYALGVALFFVAERYRLPLFVGLSVLAGGAIDAVLQLFRQPSPGATRPGMGRIACAAGLFAAGALAAFWPFHLEDGRVEERLRLAKALMNQHDYGAAAMELERAHALRPADTATEFNLGMALVSSGRGQEGLAHAKHAVDAGVPIDGARYALANAMLATGDRGGAAALLGTFSPAPDDSADSCYQVALLAINAGAPRAAERYLVRALELRPDWGDATEQLRRVRR